MTRLLSVFVGVGLMLCVGVAHANLILNGSFETVPDGSTGQGFLPPPWVTVPVGADTYSNDGSYGLAPADFGNFPGVTAFDGIRWGAGWSLVPERFGESLGAALIAGQTYRLSGALHQALRGDLDHSGGYDVYVADAFTFTTRALLVNTGFTTDDTAWETFSVSFTAPANAGALPFLLFEPVAASGPGGSAYPGLDALDLEQAAVAGVPEPGTLVLVGLSLAALGLRRGRAR